jgi:hypothetical protein
VVARCRINACIGIDYGRCAGSGLKQDGKCQRRNNNNSVVRCQPNRLPYPLQAQPTKP